MLHKREISVTQFADRSPRGHDLSVFLVPSSADVLDPVWNAHARNPGKQQPFHKSSSDLVVRWEPSVRRHHPSQSHPSDLPQGPAGQRSWGDPWTAGFSLTSQGKLPGMWSHGEHLRCWDACQGKLVSFSRREPSYPDGLKIPMGISDFWVLTLGTFFQEWPFCLSGRPLPKLHT